MNNLLELDVSRLSRREALARLGGGLGRVALADRKSTRLNSSH